MTIIEKEIARRENILVTAIDKQQMIATLKAEIEELTRDVAGIDTDVLKAEIAELKTYLPTEPAEESVEAEVAAEEVAEECAVDEISADAVVANTIGAHFIV